MGDNVIAFEDQSKLDSIEFKIRFDPVLSLVTGTYDHLTIWTSPRNPLQSAFTRATGGNFFNAFLVFSIYMK
jgi:hypothetical protein